MKLEICLLLIQCTIFWNQYDFSNSKPIMGSNIKQAIQNEFPFVVPLIRITRDDLTTSRDLLCTGTLISQEDVLTAEHCFKYLHANSSIEIAVGSISLLKGTKYNIAWWITYDQWAVHTNRLIQFGQNDIAIIRLLVRIEVTPAHLSNIPTHRLYGLIVTIAGWGLSNNNTFVTVLQTATLKTLTRTECIARISRINNDALNLDQRYICSVADPYILLNNGDSGGPLLYEGNLIAVNKGTCPFRRSKFHPEEVNAHLGIEYYGKFILHVLYYY